MKKVIVIVLILLAAVLLIGAAVFGVFAYKNLHWYDKYDKMLTEVGAAEKQVILPGGAVINYGEVENDKPALLLIHGQMAAWEDYAVVLQELSENWHVYAVDVYGHGESGHDPEGYYLDTNGNDLIWFIDHVIGEKTVVCGHSNGALIAAYIGAYGGENIVGVVLEDPPVFSTEGEDWENSFAYLDTYKPLHDFNRLSEDKNLWPGYYLEHCYWGQLYMKDSMPGIARYARHYGEKHPGEEVKIFFMPPSVTMTFHYVQNYDFAYGERFYDLTWNHGYTHKEILSAIEVPCIYLHAKENRAETGVYLCAATRDQAERAVKYIGENCRLMETDDSDHLIHKNHKDVYLQAVNSMLPKE